MKCSTEKIRPKKTLTIFDVHPLGTFPVSGLVFEFLYVGFPCDVVARPGNVCFDCILDRVQRVAVIENTLGDQAAWRSDSVRIERCPIDRNVVTCLIVVKDRRTLCQLRRAVREDLPTDLRVRHRLDVASVVLVEVSQLIIEENRSGNVSGQSEVDRASSVVIGACRIVLNLSLADVVAHHIQRDSQSQEDQSKHQEDNHGATVAGYWPPSSQCLLLESVALEGFELFLAPLSFLLRNIHFY